MRSPEPGVASQKPLSTFSLLMLYASHIGFSWSIWVKNFLSVFAFDPSGTRKLRKFMASSSSISLFLSQMRFNETVPEHEAIA